MKKDNDMREKRGMDKKVPVKVGKRRLTKEKRLRLNRSEFLIFKFLNKSKIRITKTKLNIKNSMTET